MTSTEKSENMRRSGSEEVLKSLVTRFKKTAKLIEQPSKSIYKQ